MWVQVEGTSLYCNIIMWGTSEAVHLCLQDTLVLKILSLPEKKNKDEKLNT